VVEVRKAIEIRCVPADLYRRRNLVSCAQQRHVCLLTPDKAERKHVSPKPTYVPTLALDDFEKGCLEFGQKYRELPTFGKWLKNVRVSTEKLITIATIFWSTTTIRERSSSTTTNRGLLKVLLDCAWQEAEGMLIIPENERDPNLPKKFGFAWAD